MSHSTVREYVVRLRRLDELLSSKAFPATTEFSTEIIQAQLSEDLSDSALSNYNIALRKYEQYLDWQGKH